MAARGQLYTRQQERKHFQQAAGAIQEVLGPKIENRQVGGEIFL